MHQNADYYPRLRETYRARPRPVPPPGAIASASLPGYRRAGVGAGCVDPLPPTAPPRHLSGPANLRWWTPCVLARLAFRALGLVCFAQVPQHALQDAAVAVVADLVRGVEPYCR